MSDRLPTSSSGRRRRDDVGDFWVDGEIGKGSFATVYRGYHKVRTPPFALPQRLAAITPRTLY
jgi:hypothetical protein